VPWKRFLGEYHVGLRLANRQVRITNMLGDLP
jgi:hypothetical protein